MADDANRGNHSRSRFLPLFALLVASSSATSSCATPASPRGPVALATPDAWTIDLFDVGTGLSLLVRGSDFSLLYDAGSNDDRSKGQSNRVLAYLEHSLGKPSLPGCPRTPADIGPRIDVAVLSHPHQDHQALFPDVFRCYPVGEVWIGNGTSETKVQQAFEEAAAPLKQRRVQTGERLPLGRRATAEVLSARSHPHDENDASVVLRLDLGDRCVLLMGDAEAGPRDATAVAPKASSVEGELLRTKPDRLRCEVLVVGHHGSLSSTRPAFLDAVGPRWALLSSGPFPYSGVTLPDPEVVASLQRRNVQILRTDTDDAACRRSTSKVGGHKSGKADGKPGGCDGVRLILGSQVSVTRTPARSGAAGN